MMDINYGAVREQIKATPARSAWRRGVSAYALELLDSVAGRAAYEGHGPEDVAQLRKWMLDGARDWSEYSYGGCSLVYDGDIAERLCTPSELRRMADELAAEIDSLQDAIKQHMDAAGVDTLAGLDYKITYKTVTSSRLDSKSLKADQPDLYAKYTKQTTARRFCLA